MGCKTHQRCDYSPFACVYPQRDHLILQNNAERPIFAASQISVTRISSMGFPQQIFHLIRDPHPASFRHNFFLTATKI
jgi:hypothetical protein